IVATTPLGPRVLRRSRGFSPVPIALPRAAREPVLALGGHQKVSACVVLGDQAFLTPHLGDLGLVEGEAAYARDVEGFERLLGVRAEVLAHDLHPDYASTRYALTRPARVRIGVQHHLAHVLATLAELRIVEPVVGVAFDGSGYGTDGTAWGGELLLVDGGSWTRLCSTRPLPLPGGERAIRETWRVAFSALALAFGRDEALALAPRLRVFDGVPALALATLSRMLATGTAVVPARGIGRWFDAVGALALGLPRASFDGHVALALEEAAASDDVVAYPCGLPGALAAGEPLGPEHELDLGPVVRAAVTDLLDGASAARVSARFHRTLVDATAALARAALSATGVGRVVLTGGCFQNRRLEQGVVERLGRAQVSSAREVPVNDGGLALGQAWAAVLALECAPH
ncbi:MAG TPA: carbamoyltransferase HypF, partial [Polyangiaceae bacterium]|nr:carbamoyltransferase HypF [Polyangiaceae bacterium]